MELNKHSITVNKAFRQNLKSFESLGDIVIPDSLPDVLNILYVDATPVINENLVNSEQLTLNGDTEFNILYYSAETPSKIIRFSTSIPFRVSFDVEKLMPESAFNIIVKPKNIHSTLINSRKISVSAEIEVKTSLFDTENIEFIKDISDVNSLQVLSKTCDIPTILAFEKIKTTIKDTATIPSSLPNIDEILKYTCKIINIETVISEDKILFKGELCLTIYYTTSDEMSIFTYDILSPYSGSANIANVPQDSNISIDSYINNISIKILPDTDDSMISFEASIITSIVVLNSENVNLIMDLYSTQNEALPVFDDNIVTEVSPKMNEKISFKETTNINESEPIIILASFGLIKNAHLLHDSNIPMLTGDISIVILYKIEASNEIKSVYIDLPFSHNLTSNINNLHDIYIENIDVLNLGNEKIDINISLYVSGHFIDTKNVNLLKDLTISETESKQKTGLTVYFPKSDESLWQIAKKHNTTIDNIKKINSTDDPINSRRPLVF